MTGRIFDPADLTRLIQMASAAGPDAVGTLELLRTVRRGEIACMFASAQFSTSEFKKFTRENAGVPSVVVIGDDAGDPVGPYGFRIAQRAVEWAHSALVHAAGAETKHYQFAIDRAKQCKRVLIVECTSSHLNDWLKLVKPSRKPTLIVVPRGGQHPISPREAGKTLH